MVESEERLRFEGLRVSMLINDLKPECLARVLLVFKALEALGEALEVAGGETVIERTQQSPDAASLAYLVYHLYLGAFIMPGEQDWLRNTMEEFKNRGLQRSFPWLHLDDTTSTKLIEVFDKWIGLCNTFTCEEMKRLYQKAVKKKETVVHGELATLLSTDTTGRLSSLEQFQVRGRYDKRLSLPWISN
jgi:hypothetical protein